MNLEDLEYKDKYLKYKNKYLDLKNDHILHEQHGGVLFSTPGYYLLLYNNVGFPGPITKKTTLNTLTDTIFKNNSGCWYVNLSTVKTSDELLINKLYKTFNSVKQQETIINNYNNSIFKQISEMIEEINTQNSQTTTIKDKRSLLKKKILQFNTNDEPAQKWFTTYLYLLKKFLFKDYSISVSNTIKDHITPLITTYNKKDFDEDKKTFDECFNKEILRMRSWINNPKLFSTHNITFNCNNNSKYKTNEDNINSFIEGLIFILNNVNDKILDDSNSSVNYYDKISNQLSDMTNAKYKATILNIIDTENIKSNLNQTSIRGIPTTTEGASPGASLGESLLNTINLYLKSNKLIINPYKYLVNRASIWCVKNIAPTTLIFDLDGEIINTNTETPPLYFISEPKKNNIKNASSDLKNKFTNQAKEYKVENKIIANFDISLQNFDTGTYNSTIFLSTLSELSTMELVKHSIGLGK